MQNEGASQGSSAGSTTGPSGSPHPASSAWSEVWARVKEHKVAQWTLAYAAFAYTVLHAMQMAREAFEWPTAVSRVTFLVLLLGAPVAATLAWYHGQRARQRISGAELSILTVLLLIAGSLLWVYSGGRRGAVASVVARTAPAATAISKKSIAVLPFVDLSEKRDQEYFADGMAEEVIDLLANIPGLKVIARTSSFQFKGKNQDLRAIGNALGVDYVVEGSVRRSGERLRVTAQLINAQDGSHLWSDTYDAPVGDTLKVQDQIASNLARALQVSVGADYWLEHATFKSPEAYDLYLRGRHAADRFDKEGIDSAVGYFQQVLELDPTSIPALEWLALLGHTHGPPSVFWLWIRSRA